MKRVFLFAFMAAASCAPAFAAEQVDLTTYYDAPFGDYRDLDVDATLTAGVADANPGPININGSSYTAAFYGRFELRNNEITGRHATARGGVLTATGNLEVQGSGGQTVLFVDGANDRVGVGTASPSVALDVAGHVKAMSLYAYEDPLDENAPYAEMYSQWNDQSRFSAAYFEAGSGLYRYCTLHIDGSPLVMESVGSKGAWQHGLGYGQVVIKGMNGGYGSGDGSVILAVGEPYLSAATGQGDYPDTLASEAWAHAWGAFSSREFKKDIFPYAAADYGAALDRLASHDVYLYRYNGEKLDARRRYGFLAEKAPKDFVTEGEQAVDLGEEAAFLLAAARALHEEQASMVRRVEDLKK